MRETKIDGHSEKAGDSREWHRGVRPEHQEVIALVDSRRLERECFVRSIELLHPHVVILSYSGAEALAEAIGASPRPHAILFNVGSRQVSDSDVIKELEALMNMKSECPVVVLAPSDDLDQMIAALDAGAAGYIPASLGIEGIVEGAKLAASGGVFLRRESLAKFKSTVPQTETIPPELQNLTWRQSAVADALRRGKANKTIAYELNMCESTVKVHIRNIMRKLKATNRTEAAYKLNSILPSPTVNE